MEEEKYQKELFQFEEPKKPFSKLTDMLPKRDFEGKVALSLTLEKMVFISIGIVMAMVVVFALGVESGKSRAAAAKQRPAQSASGTAKAIPPIAATQAMVPAQKGFFNTAPAAPQARPLQPDSAAAAKPYTIVAATFSKKDTAQASAAFLAKEGFNASVVYNDPYYRVCVGSYADMSGTQVQRDLAKVKRIYKDAFVRGR